MNGEVLHPHLLNYRSTIVPLGANRQITVVAESHRHTLDIVILVRICKTEIPGLAMVGVIPRILVKDGLDAKDRVLMRNRKWDTGKDAILLLRLDGKSTDNDHVIERRCSQKSIDQGDGTGPRGRNRITFVVDVLLETRISVSRYVQINPSGNRLTFKRAVEIENDPQGSSIQIYIRNRELGPCNLGVYSDGDIL